MAAAVFALSLAALYGASAAYHRSDRLSTSREWLKRLDHSMIFVLIAGTYTPFCLLVMPSPWSWILLAVVWAGAALGIVLKTASIDGFRRLSGALYMTLGWIGVLMAPFAVGRLSPAVLALVLAGGLLYTAGAIVLAGKRPDPSPRWFGYHEVWHGMTIAAGTCHYAAILLVVLVTRAAVAA